MCKHIPLSNGVATMTPQPQKLSKQSGSITSPPSAPGGGFAGGAPMTPQPQQEYIITEEDIQILEDTFGVTLIMPRSRSHTPAPALERQPCKYVAGDFCDNCIDSTCGFYPFDTQHDTAIRKAEMERVLDELFPKPDQDDLKNGWEYNYRFIQKIANRTEEMDEDSSCMEQVMIVLKALEESLRGEP